METRHSENQIWAWLAEVPDPEIPIISVVDLGMVRNVTVDDARVEIDVSPTYSGCPATEVIEQSIASRLREKGLRNVRVRRVLSPPWTTDWITNAGRQKLLDYGIVPPVLPAGKRELFGERVVRCPRCNTERTSVVSEFGSTACKASYRCDECFEPFEYFKCI